MKTRALIEFVCAGAMAGLAVAPTANAAQEAYPAKPITFVIPYSPGGPTDAMARTIAVALREQLGQTVVVENKPGAGANIGAEHVARAAPDGYTMMLGTPAPLAINVSLFRKLNYHPLRDFARGSGLELTAYQPLVKGQVATDPVLMRIAEELGTGPAAVALAFLMAEGHIVIPASASRTNLQNNWDATTIILTPEHMDQIRRLDRGYRHINPAKSPRWDD